MNLEQCCLVITSSVRVSAKYTSLLDPGQRETQYLDALSWFITDSPLVKIVVCDNSGYRYPSALCELATAHEKQLELLSFTGNNRLVEEFGKGYGEGEIMEFVLLHSFLLQESDGFLKVTGRLKVTNIAQVLRSSRVQENYFMPVSLLRPRFLVPRAARPCVDVRVYFATKAFFRSVLLTAYRDVRDDATFFLEHAYYRAIARSAGFSVRCFPTAPEITGVSGSNGWVFKERGRAKKLLIRLVSYLGYVRPV